MTNRVNITKMNSKAKRVLSKMEVGNKAIQKATDDKTYSVETFMDACKFHFQYAEVSEKADKIVDAFHEDRWYGEDDGLTEFEFIGSIDEYANTINNLHKATMDFRKVTDAFFTPIRPNIEI